MSKVAASITGIFTVIAAILGALITGYFMSKDSADIPSDNQSHETKHRVRIEVEASKDKPRSLHITTDDTSLSTDDDFRRQVCGNMLVDAFEFIKKQLNSGEEFNSMLVGAALDEFSHRMGSANSQCFEYYREHFLNLDYQELGQNTDHFFFIDAHINNKMHEAACEIESIRVVRQAREEWSLLSTTPNLKPSGEIGVGDNAYLIQRALAWEEIPVWYRELIRCLGGDCINYEVVDSGAKIEIIKKDNGWIKGRVACGKNINKEGWIQLEEESPYGGMLYYPAPSDGDG